MIVYMIELKMLLSTEETSNQTEVIKNATEINISHTNNKSKIQLCLE